MSDRDNILKFPPGLGKSATEEPWEDFWFQPEWKPEQMKDLLDRLVFEKWPDSLPILDEARTASERAMRIIAKKCRTPEEKQAQMIRWIASCIFTHGVSMAAMAGWKNSALLFEQMGARLRWMNEEWQKDNE